MARYIDKDKLVNKLKEDYATLVKERWFDDYVQGYSSAIDDVVAEPTADVQEVKHGKWILRGGWNRCSVCDGKALLKDAGGIGGLHEYDQVKSDICPYCSAKMDGKET